VFVFDVSIVNFTIFIKSNIMFLKPAHKSLGLSFQLGRAFGDLCNYFFVCEVLKPIMNMTSLMVHLKHTLSSLEEVVLDFLQGFFDLKLSRILDHLIKNRLVFLEGGELSPGILTTVAFSS